MERRLPSTRILVLYVAVTFVVWAFNYQFGFPVQFLRAESGLLLQEAYSSDWWRWIEPCFTSAYGGHFIPAALSFELLNTRMIGPSELLWGIRQALFLGLMAVTVAVAMKSVICLINPTANRGISLGIAVFLSLSLTAHPFMLELFSWPFMWMQMACLTCAALSLHRLMEFISKPTRANAFWCTISAYASMHFLGIGLAVSAATIISLSLSAYAIGEFPKARAALASGLFLTVLHAIPSALSGGGKDGPIQVFSSAARFLTLVIEQPLAAMRAMFATPWLAMPEFPSVEYQIVSGAAVLIIIIAGFARLWADAAATGSNNKIALAASLTYPLAAYLGVCLLTVARLRAETDESVLQPFMIGGRYLIFPMFFGALIFAIAFRPDHTGLLASVIVLVALSVSSALFVRDSAPHLWPDRLLSNQKAWERIQSNPAETFDMTRYGEFAGDSCRYSSLTGGPPCPGHDPWWVAAKVSCRPESFNR